MSDASTNNNIEMFEEFTAKIFAMLYNSFPIPKDIWIHDVINEKPQLDEHYNLPFDTLPDQNASASDFHQFYELLTSIEQSPEYEHQAKVFESTIEWLHKSQYLNYNEQYMDYQFRHVTLTAKGLEVMKCVPVSIDDNKVSIGDKISSEVKNAGREAYKQLVKIALTEGYKLFM